MKIHRYIWSIGLFLMLLFNLEAPARAGEKSGLRPVDETALGDRIPLILIHGINPQTSPLYGWSGFLRAAANNTGFQGGYKSYFFIYPTADSIRNNGARLKDALLAFRQQHPSTPSFRMVALSLGGLVAKQALQDKTLQQATDRVITLGTPFHGSPLANPEWIHAALQQRSPLHIMRMNHRLAYRITRHRFPYFQQDFQWDNFDGALPERLAIMAAQSEKDIQATQASLGEQPGFYTYAAFFGQSPADEQWLTQTLQLQAAPKSSTVKRRSLVSRHMAFQLAQPCLASLPVPKQADSLSMMRFNDGISPISSQLWLGRYLPAPGETPLGELSYDTMWQAAIRLKSSNAARLFEGLDHRDWLTGKTRYQKSGGRVADWLHPDEAPRTIYDWLLKDLEN